MSTATALFLVVAFLGTMFGMAHLWHKQPGIALLIIFGGSTLLALY